MKYLSLLFSLTLPLMVNAQWQSNNFDVIQITSLDAIDSNVFIGTTAGLYISKDYGITFPSSGFSQNVYPIRTVLKTGTILLVGTNNAMIKSVNGGTTWSPIFTFVNFTVYSIIQKGSNIFSASLFGIHISTDNGNIWTNVSNGLPALSTPTKLVSNNSSLFTIADSIVFLSTNDGANWDTANTGLENNPVRTLTINGSTIYAGTNHGVFISTDNGEHWIVANTGLSNTPINSIVVVGTNIIVASPSGVYLSNNNGMSWTSINMGLPNNNIGFLAVSGNTLFATLKTQTTNGELWNRPLSQLTGLEVLETNQAFNLFPNPSSGKITISDNESKIHRIEIFNVLGEKIISKYPDEGLTSHLIDLTNYKGVYFVVLNDRCSLKTIHKILLE